MDKILFWVDIGLEHFGIAKFFKQKYECQMYCIYDINNHLLKKSFENQKLVNFEKEWFYWDHVIKTKTKPNLDYLKQIENKYDINLWMLTYADRRFNKYNTLHKFSKNEILSILEQECRLFERILDEVKPDFLLIKLTDLRRTELLKQIAKAKGTTILMLMPTRVGLRASISQDFKKIDNISEFKDSKIERNTEELKQFIERTYVIDINNIVTKGVSLSLTKKISLIFNWVKKSNTNEYKSSYDHYGATFNKMWIHVLQFELKRKYRKRFIDKNFIHVLPKNEKFIYFPLHIEPERTLSTDAPFFENQIELIKSIAKSIPIEYKLYVKEHYMMSDRYRNWRKISEYKEILDLPNVRLIHPTVRPEIMLKNCELAITISGSTGIEATLHKKPTIIFSDIIYENLPSVFRVKNLNELPKIIKSALNTQVTHSELNNFLSFIEENSFERDLDAFHVEVMDEFFNKAFIISDNISMEKLDEFFEKHRNELENLAEEHIKRLKFFKNKTMQTL